MMAEIERAVSEHPEWSVPEGGPALEPKTLESKAEQVKREGNRLFWSEPTGRFCCAVDIDGVGHDYGFTFLNQVSTVGSFVLAASMLPFFYNVYKSSRGPQVTVDDPWGWGRSLEWATSCPPPRHNFVSLPRIRSESPAFDLHHPEVAAIELEENEAARTGRLADAPDMEGREETVRGRVSGDEDVTRTADTDHPEGNA